MATPESARARVRSSARQALLEASPTMDMTALATVRGSTLVASRQWVRDRTDARVLIVVEHRTQMLVPDFQLTDLHDVRPEVAGVTARLLSFGMSAWATWAWYFAANTWLGMARPIDELVERPGAVQLAVDGLVQ